MCVSMCCDVFCNIFIIYFFLFPGEKQNELVEKTCNNDTLVLVFSVDRPV